MAFFHVFSLGRPSVLWKILRFSHYIAGKCGGCWQVMDSLIKRIKDEKDILCSDCADSKAFDEVETQWMEVFQSLPRNRRCAETANGRPTVIVTSNHH